MTTSSPRGITTPDGSPVLCPQKKGNYTQKLSLRGCHCQHQRWTSSGCRGDFEQCKWLREKENQLPCEDLNIYIYIRVQQIPGQRSVIPGCGKPLVYPCPSCIHLTGLEVLSSKQALSNIAPGGWETQCGTYIRHYLCVIRHLLRKKYRTYLSWISWLLKI